MVRPAPEGRPGTRKKQTRITGDGNESQLPQSSSEFIKTITQLKRKPNNEQALFTLHRIASLVKPIMKQYGFKVGTLCEFFPKDPRLLGLNVNHGMKICIRLRPAYDENMFYPLEDTVGTMLHELTHNKFGPHDQKFYKFLDEITSKLEGLMANGYCGDGFFSKGNIVGGNGLKPVSMEEARKKALEAIEKRKILYSGSGQRLGGNVGKNSLSMKELILIAAERRAKDSKWCASEHVPASEDLGVEDDDGFEILGVNWDGSRSTTPSSSRGGTVTPVSSKSETVTVDSDRKSSSTPVSVAGSVCDALPSKKRNIEVLTIDSDEENSPKRLPARRDNDTVFIDLTNEID